MRLELKERTVEEVSLFWKETQKDSIQRTFPFSVNSLEEAIKLFEETKKPDSKSFGKTIFLDGQYVGDVWVYGIDETEEKMGMLSIVIFNENVYGKGLGTEAIKQFLPLVKERYRIEKVGAFVFADNIPSIRMLEKAGFLEADEFIEEGRLSKYFEFYFKNTEEKSLNELSQEELGQKFPIKLEPYNSEWPKHYEEEEIELRKALPDEVIVRLQHFGSTAVKGLTAKPTIDILLEIHRNTELDSFRRTLIELGFRYNPQPDNPPPHMMFMKGYTDKGFEGKTVHLHVRYPADWSELYFRDFLREFPEEAAAYEKVKQELKAKYTYDREKYTEGKTEFIKSRTELARMRYGNRYKIEGEE